MKIAWNKGLKGLQPWHNISGLKPGNNKGKSNPKVCGKNHWLYGKHHSNETRKKISEKLKGKLANENNPEWKGDDVGYRSLHKWIYSHLKRPSECVYCGEDQKRIEWASISHHAKRDLTDYISLCVACHREYDKKARLQL